MFRGRTDFSWPLIVVLAGLFFLSLKLPRQWERIARPTPLLLKTHTLLPSKVLPSISTSREETPLKAFYSVEPSGYVANNDDAMPALSAGNAARQVVVAPVAMSKSQVSEVVPAAAPLEESIAIAGNADDSAESRTGKVLLPVPIATSASVLPHPQIETKRVDTRFPKTDDVQVSRDAPASAPATNLAADNQVSNKIEVRRLPSPTTTVVPTQPFEQVGEGPDGVQQSHPTAVALKPSVAAESSAATAESAPNSVRLVVPEPKPSVEQNLPPANPQPVPSQHNAVATADSTKPTDGAKPTENVKSADRAEAVIPPARTSAVAEPPMKAIGRAWEEPVHLLVQLDELKKHEITRAWATEVSATVHSLGPAISVGAAETTEILQHLERLGNDTPTLLTKISEENLAQNLSRTSLGLVRRITVWKQIGQMGGMVAADAPAPAGDPRSFNKCLSDIDQLTSNSSEGHAWRKYLLIESLHEWAARHRNSDERLPRDLAQQVLKRLNQMSVTSRQRQFLTSGPVASLHQEMLRHTAEPVESNRLLQHLENYEESGLPSDAQLLARDCQFLGVSSGAAQRELGERVEMHYRNANIRIAVTAGLINRMIPKREPEFAPVQDTIQGAAVRGESLMANDISVRMIPDPHHVRMAFEVNGEVASLTRSTAGPATFYSDSESSYLARKPLEINLRGIRVWPTEVAVDNNSKLQGIRTDFDRVPIVREFARNMARSEHDARMPAAEAEVREKIAAKAKERVDRETTEQISAAAKRLHDEVLGPMDSLLLDPMMVAAETTEKRFSMRIRLAGADQLGGHTPRPQAPSDSLASIQIHESMLNNILERLELNGQTFDLAGLGRRLAERLHRYKPKPVDPDQEDVKITFAARDAVHVRCYDGRMEITLAIARLSNGAYKWKNFQVRAFYRPVVRGRSVDLARDGIVQLIGVRTAQLGLRGVFLKVFSQKEPLHATPESFVKNPKLDGVVVTQFVVDDGWIGAAIGPQRTVTAQMGTARR